MFPGALLVRAACLAGALLLAQGVAHAEDGPVRASIERVLAEWRARPNPSPDRLIALLVAIGPKAEPHLCALLAERTSKPVPVEPLAMALAKVGGSPETLAVLGQLVTAPETATRLTGTAALGEIASIACLPHLLRALDDDSFKVRSAGREAILRVRRSHPDSNVVARIRRALETLEHEDQAALLLGDIGTSEAREGLRDLIEQWYDQDKVLAGLGGLWIAARAEDAPSIHELLTPTQTIAIQRKACLLLGKLEDAAATRDLIDRLYSDQPGLVADAHWALLEITGLQLRASPELWEIWWERVGARQEP